VDSSATEVDPRQILGLVRTIDSSICREANSQAKSSVYREPTNKPTLDSVPSQPRKPTPEPAHGHAEKIDSQSTEADPTMISNDQQADPEPRPPEIRPQTRTSRPRIQLLLLSQPRSRPQSQLGLPENLLLGLAKLTNKPTLDSTPRTVSKPTKPTNKPTPDSAHRNRSLTPSQLLGLPRANSQPTRSLSHNSTAQSTTRVEVKPNPRSTGKPTNKPTR
jgi:hypothetical protein